jgi:hypothetical protein
MGKYDKSYWEKKIKNNPLSLTTYKVLFFCPFRIWMPFQNEILRLGLKTVHTYKNIYHMPAMTTAETNWSKPSANTGTTIKQNSANNRPVWNDSTLGVRHSLNRRIFWQQCCSRTRTREDQVGTNLFFAGSPPTSHYPNWARMTQMGRSCKVIQKTGKTVLLH